MAASKTQPTVAEVRAQGQPPGLLDRRSAEHWAGRLYMRRISPYFTWLSVRAGLSANTLTGLMIVVGMGGCLLLVVPGLAASVGAALLIQAYLLLDCSDGEVARFTRTTSMKGVYLDRIGHFVVESGLIVALGVRAAEGAGLGWVVWGLAGALFVMLEKVETDLVEVARAKGGMAPASDDHAAITNPALATGRRLASLFPLHRLTHAIEASLLVVVAAVADEVDGSLAATRGLLVAFTLISGAMVVLHLVSILMSRRLTAP